jgi:hypothetical protein
MDFNNSNNSGSLPAWKWTGAEALEWVRDLNARCLEAIGKRRVRAATARLDDDGVSINLMDIDLWRRLDEAARLRAARCPYLLVELRFDDAAWWHDAKRDAMKPVPNPAASSSGTAGLGRALANDALNLAWWTARADQRTAMLLFGLDPRVAAVIASLSPVEVRRITARSGNQLRPRWERNHRIWRDLLSAAISADEEALTDIHLYGIQLLGGDLFSMGKAP